MPFTFSHPAVVLPIKKMLGDSVSLTGLVIGSIIPDFEYFIRMKIESKFSHSVLGLFWFDVPLGLVLTFVYHLIVRDPLITNLPKALNRRLSQFKGLDWKSYFRQHWFIVIVSIVVGAASHLFWDDFTHPTGYFVKRSVFLRHTIAIGHIHIQLFNVLQHLSSIAGGLAILIAIFSLKSEYVWQSEKKLNYWLLVIFIAVLIFVIRILTGLDLHLYGNVIVTIISAFLIGLTLASLYPAKSSEA